jgi:serine/threonine protein kinase, bacterial
MNLLLIRTTCFLLAATTAGCGAASVPVPASAPSMLQTAPQNVGWSPATTGQKIYVTEAGSVNGDALILEFPTTAKGNVAPAVTIVEPEPQDGYNKATAVSIASSGEIYVANGGVGGNSDILVYAADASGNATPLQTISGAATSLDGPIGLTVNKSGVSFAANIYDGTVTSYAKGDDGNVAPKTTIAGSKTGLVYPNSVVLDGSGHIYVADQGAGAVFVFAPNANGNVAPIRTIAGSKTGLIAPSGLAHDAAGHLYVIDHTANRISVFASSVNGNVAPLRTIAGSKTQISVPHDLALDSAGNIYVLCGGVLVFAAGASGNVAPLRTLAGSKTEMGVNTNLTVH